MASLLRLGAIVSCALVLLGFIAFVSDEAGSGSKQQVAKLSGELGDPAPSPATEAERQRRHGAVREKIDDANDILLAPFTGIVDSRDIWVKRIVPGLLALLAYGLGVGLLANALPKRTPASRDWRLSP
jgi:hypothetical protein